MLLFADTHTLTPNLITDVRFSYSDRLNHAVSPGLGADPGAVARTEGRAQRRFPADHRGRFRQSRLRHA